MGRPSNGHWPTFTVRVGEAASCPLEDGRLDELAVSHLRFDGPLPERAQRFCLVYEGILRRMFRECTALDDDVHIGPDGIHLNAIDDMSSALIVQFLAAPSPAAYAQLRDVLRSRHAATAAVAALIICRNLGIPARRLVTLHEWAAYWDRLTNPVQVHGMQKGPPSPQELLARGAEYVVIESDPPLIICGQTSPVASTTAQSLLIDKPRASAFLRRYGHRVPDHVLVPDERHLDRIDQLDTIIFKPSHGSGRRGVVGPVATRDRERVLQCYRRCRAQMPSSATAMAERYIAGTHYRINVNHGRVTFVAQSQRNEVVGNGTATISELLTVKRRAAGFASWHADSYIENVIGGSGLDMSSIPPAGERVTLSHDGNEEGRKLDVTDTFPQQFVAEALAVASTCRCPVMGIDAIVDATQRLWIIEVNASRPAISLFDDLSRAYQTMEHMIRSVLDERDRHSCLSLTPERCAIAAR
jgi:hypothetical protein